MDTLLRPDPVRWWIRHEDLRHRHRASRARQHDERGAGSVRRAGLHPAFSAGVPRCRPADRLRQHRASRGQSAGGRIGGHRRAGGGVEHRGGAPDPHQQQRRTVEQHHARVQPGPRCRGGGPGCPGQGRPGARAPAQRGAGAGGGQAGGRRQSVLLARARGRELRPAAAVRYRRPGGEDPAADPPRGGPGPDLRRAAVLHAGLAVGFRADRAGPDRGGCRERDSLPERGNPGRTDRILPAGIHRAEPGGAEDARGVRRPGRGQSRRPDGPSTGPRHHRTGRPG